MIDISTLGEDPQNYTSVIHLTGRQSLPTVV
jgi:hypothetical protein